MALLKILSQKTPLQPDDESRVWEAYREIERLLSSADAEDDPTATAWWRDFVASGLYWTDRDAFWSNDGDVFVNDHGEFFELFKGRGDYAFIKLPENQFPSFQRLIEAGGIRMLSDAVEVGEVTHKIPGRILTSLPSSGRPPRSL